MAIPTAERSTHEDVSCIAGGPGVATRELVADITRGILASRPPLESARLDLAGGLAGQALLLAEVSMAGVGEHGYRDLTRACVEKIARDLPNVALGPGLYNGLAGVAWVLHHLGVRFAEPEWLDPECYAEVYAYYDAYLAQPGELEYDLVAGLAGIGLWALTIADEMRCQRMIEAIVSRLAQSAEETSEGITWRTPPFRFRRRVPDAPEPPAVEYNLGLAHGIPGVIGFLAECVRRNVAADASRALLVRAVSWLSARRLADPFGTFGDVAVSTRATRLAWCYGDPGVVIALFKAADALRSQSLRALALSVAEKSAVRPVAKSWVRDTGICHGAAGLALIYSQLRRREPGSQPLAEAADKWHGALLDMRRADCGICGFHAWTQADGYVTDATWLTGAAGVALVLLSQLTGSTAWAAPLLLATHEP